MYNTKSLKIIALILFFISITAFIFLVVSCILSALGIMFLNVWHLVILISVIVLDTIYVISLGFILILNKRHIDKKISSMKN